MKAKVKRPHLPLDVVEDWLAENFPELVPDSEVQGAWLWLVTDLRGEHNKAKREALKAQGFRFAPRMDHKLPSGRIGLWANACEKPTRFRGGKAKTVRLDGNTNNIGEMSADQLAALLT